VTLPFPPARGSRVPWEALGQDVLAALEVEFGAPVAHAETQFEGFSPAVAAVVEFDNGTKAFVKAVNRQANPDSPGIYRTEVIIAEQLPSASWAPKLLWSYDDGEWVALAFEHVEGHTPAMPWRRVELDRVLLLLADLARDSTPTGVEAGALAARHGAAFSSWRDLVEHGHPDIGDLARVEPWAATHVERLAVLEAGWEKAAEGSTLVHGDVRADNVLLTDDGVMLVDWASAAVGASWVDLALFLPSVAMQGGPASGELFAIHPLGSTAPADGVTAVLCAFTGYLLCRSLQPAPPGLPTVRAFQRGQGLMAAAWLRERTGW
jgi:aminoglycoside phosphotransferase